MAVPGDVKQQVENNARLDSAARKICMLLQQCLRIRQVINRCLSQLQSRWCNGQVMERRAKLREGWKETNTYYI